MPPNRHVLRNLRSADKYARVQFWEARREKHPDSFEVLEILIIVLTEARNQGRVVHLCTQLLDQSSWDSDGTARKLRWWRYNAALGTLDKQRRGPYQTVPQDFVLLWQDPQLREELVADLARVGDPAVIPQLVILTNETQLPAAVRQFLKAKIDELHSLVELLEELGQPTL